MNLSLLHCILVENTTSFITTQSLLSSFPWPESVADFFYIISPVSLLFDCFCYVCTQSALSSPVVVIFIAQDGIKVCVIKKHLLCDEPHTSLLGIYVVHLS